MRAVAAQESKASLPRHLRRIAAISLPRGLSAGGIGESRRRTGVNANQYRQLVRSAPVGALFSIRWTIFGANIWWYRKREIAFGCV